MKLLKDLVSTDYGLMSLAVITITLCMAAFFVRMFVGKMNSEGPAGAAPRVPAPGGNTPAH